MENTMKLMYQEPASVWEETLPLGNGSLGGMVWGSIASEKIGLNQETIWSGYYRNKNNPKAKEHLPVVRSLIASKKYEEADGLIQQELLGEYGESYLPVGNLRIDTPNLSDISDYHRELSLDEATANVAFKSSGQLYTREYFVSYPHQAMFIKLTGPAQEVAVYFESELKYKETVSENGIRINGKCPEHVDPQYAPDASHNLVQGNKGQEFEGNITIFETDGHINLEGNRLIISQAQSIVLMVSFVNKAQINWDLTYSELKAEHLLDYQKIYRKVDLYLGEQLQKPTNQRLKELKAGAKDPGLYGLYFQYGRYLLIASSREGSLPANLQGIWCWQMRAPWSSNWTININLQMNYWHAQTCNLAECLSPYFTFLEKIVNEGKKTATENYGMRGFVAHHNLDYWGNTNPAGIFYGDQVAKNQSSRWSMWPMGGSWLCQELFKHYEYSLDRTFLEQTAYPILREAVLFLNDWLVEQDGWYGTNPSSSPENQFLTANGSVCTVTESSAMDLELVQEVFRDFEKTCTLLNIQDEVYQEMKEKQAKLRPLQIGRRGQLLEWSEEFLENEPGHRHLSHLYGLFPSDLFADKPELIKASEISLRERLAAGSGHTGWSCAWIINLYAILDDADNAYKYLEILLKKSTLDNLWDTHPPFQIDGNFGGTAGIANMLVQERNDQVKILPALPQEFKSGYVRGLRLKNRKMIDISWENGELVASNIYE